MSTNEPTTTTAFRLTREGLDLRFRRVELVERVWETDEYVRVRLRGADLAGFASPGSDDHMRLFFPEGAAESVDQLRESPSREYTPLVWGDDWLEVEFMIHGAPGERGVAAEWAASAPLGSVIGVGGPRGSMQIEGVPDAWFLAGDEAAVPAIRRFAALMPDNAVGRILVEVPDAAHELAIDAPSGIVFEYAYRGTAKGGVALAARLDAIASSERPAGEVFAFIASEQAIVKHGRALVLNRWGLDPERVVVKGYWKSGDAEFHAPH